MKKKTIMILAACMACMAAGCGNAKADGEAVSGTEASSQISDGSTASVDIEYEAGDYVTLGDYSNLEVTLNELDYEVTDEKLNSYVDQQIAGTQPYVADETKTVVGEGDVVDVDYVGKKDGEAFDGGSAENQYIDVSANSNATVGTGYIEGFTDGLIGAKVGDTVDCDVTFPEEYQSEELAGQAVVFTFTVNAICKKVERANIDDAYVLANFQAESVDAFYANARADLEESAEEGKKYDIRTKVSEKLSEICTVNSFPEGLIDARLREYTDSFRNYYCPNGADLDEFLQSNYGMTEEAFVEQAKTSLEDSLERELIFEAIAKNENVEFDEEGYQQYISGILANGGYPSEDTLYESFGAGRESGENYFHKAYLSNKAWDLLADRAKVTYTKEDTEAVTEGNTEG